MNKRQKKKVRKNIKISTDFFFNSENWKKFSLFSLCIAKIYITKIKQSEQNGERKKKQNRSTLTVNFLMVFVQTRELLPF